MNKRLRKKLRKGEFQELGFKLEVSLVKTLDENDLDQWVDDFIEAVEGLALSVGGGGHYGHVYVVSSASKRGSVSVTQQEELGRWLSANSMVEKYHMSKLFDQWYPPKYIFAET
jgi:Uncharacterized protein conserved in bacteria